MCKLKHTCLQTECICCVFRCVSPPVKSMTRMSHISNTSLISPKMSDTEEAAAISSTSAFAHGCKTSLLVVLLRFVYSGRSKADSWVLFVKLSGQSPPCPCSVGSRHTMFARLGILVIPGSFPEKNLRCLPMANPPRGGRDTSAVTPFVWCEMLETILKALEIHEMQDWISYDEQPDCPC